MAKGTDGYERCERNRTPSGTGLLDQGAAVSRHPCADAWRRRYISMLRRPLSPTGSSWRWSSAPSCVVSGWPHAHDARARWRLIWTQVCIRGASSRRHELVLLPSVQAIANSDTTEPLRFCCSSRLAPSSPACTSPHGGRRPMASSWRLAFRRSPGSISRRCSSR